MGWLPLLGIDGSGVGSILMKLGANYKWLFFTKTIFILLYFILLCRICCGSWLMAVLNAKKPIHFTMPALVQLKDWANLEGLVMLA